MPRIITWVDLVKDFKENNKEIWIKKIINQLGVKDWYINKQYLVVGNYYKIKIQNKNGEYSVGDCKIIG